MKLHTYQVACIAALLLGEIVVADFRPFDTATIGRVALKLPDVEGKMSALIAPYRTGDVNLMLPPVDQLDMCQPFRRRNMELTSNNDTASALGSTELRGGHRPQPQGKYKRDSAQKEVQNDRPPPSSIAIMVPLEGCSLNEKAQAAAVYQRQREADLDYVLVRGIDDPDNGVLIPNNASFLRLTNFARINLFGDLSYVFVNSNDWSRLTEQLLQRANRTGSASPYIGSSPNDGNTWSMRLEIQSTAPGGNRALTVMLAVMTVLALLICSCGMVLWFHRGSSSDDEPGAQMNTGSVELGGSKKLLSHDEVMGLPEVTFPTRVVFTTVLSDTGNSSMVTTKPPTADDGSSSLQATEPDSSSSMDGDERERSGTLCPICIHDYEEGERLRMLPACKHVFHTACILPWLTERHNCCPNCKAEVHATVGVEDKGRADVRETALSTSSNEDGPLTMEDETRADVSLPV